MINAETLMMLGGVSAFALTIHWVRRRNLRERYAIGWIMAAGLLLLCGLFPRIIMGFADTARLSYPSAALFISLAAIYCFSFIVSVSLTCQHRRSVRVMQETAILKQQLLAIEARLDDLAGPIGPDGAHDAAVRNESNRSTALACGLQLADSVVHSLV